MRAAEQLLAAGFQAGRAGLAAERAAHFFVPALPGAALPAGSARDSASAVAAAVLAGLPAARLARQTFRAARQRTRVATASSGLAAPALARHVHAPAPARAARARAVVAAIQRDSAGMTTGQGTGSYVAGRFDQVTARPDFLHLL